MKKKLVLASGNSGKIREIQTMFPEFEVIGYKSLGFDFEIEENGTTFYENSLIKAKTISDIIKLPVIADDSGLCVNAFDGWPGVLTHRFLGETANEHDRNNYISFFSDN